MRLLKYTAIFSLSSLGLAFGSILSPRVAALSWILGTLLAVLAGASFGMGARTERAATAGGACVAVASILVGCALAVLASAVSVSVLPQAVTLAFVIGAGGGAFAWLASGDRSARPAGSDGSLTTEPSPEEAQLAGPAVAATAGAGHSLLLWVA